MDTLLTKPWLLAVTPFPAVTPGLLAGRNEVGNV